MEALARLRSAAEEDSAWTMLEFSRWRSTLEGKESGDEDDAKVGENASRDSSYQRNHSTCRDFEQLSIDTGEIHLSYLAAESSAQTGFP